MECQQSIATQTAQEVNVELKSSVTRIVQFIWCVKLIDDSHAPEIVSGQLNAIKTNLKARYGPLKGSAK